MMTTNLFVIANVKQLRTGGSVRILLSFFRKYWSVGVLNSAIFYGFHNRIEFGTILEGLRNFWGEGLNLPQTPTSWYATDSKDSVPPSNDPTRWSLGQSVRRQIRNPYLLLGYFRLISDFELTEQTISPAAWQLKAVCVLPHTAFICSVLLAECRATVYPNTIKRLILPKFYLFSNWYTSELS